MKKIWVMLTLFMLMSGCVPTNHEAIKIMVPLGSPTLAFLSTLNDDMTDFHLVSGTDPLLAAFINPNQEFDIIVAPIDLGIKLIQKEATNYKLWGVLTWGNLVVVAPSADVFETSGDIALFGQHTIIQHISERALFPLLNQLTPTYYPSVADAFVSLMTNKSQAALLAQPFAQVAIQQATAQGKSFSIVMNVSDAYKQVSGCDNYPQAAIFVNQHAYAKNQENIDSLLTDVQKYIHVIEQNPTKLQTDLEAFDMTALGLPPATLLTSIWDQLQISPHPAQQVLTEISVLLEMLELHFDETMILGAK